MIAAGAAFLPAAASRAERGFPLSAVGQLFGWPALSPRQLEEAERLLEEGAAVPNPRRPSAAAVPEEVLRGLSAPLLSAADRAPLVIAVDDVHHADPASLQFLHYLVRRAGTAPIMLVLTECVRAAPPHPLLHAELLRGPRVHRLRLRTLTRDGVANVLAGHFDPLTVRRLATGCHRATGGNPLLVHALIEDHRTSGAAHPAELVFGEAFRRAVLTCLHRCEAVPYARGLAVLPPRSSRPGAGELVGLDAQAVALTGEVLARDRPDRRGRVPARGRPGRGAGRHAGRPAPHAPAPRAPNCCTGPGRPPPRSPTGSSPPTGCPARGRWPSCARRPGRSPARPADPTRSPGCGSRCAAAPTDPNAPRSSSTWRARSGRPTRNARSGTCRNSPPPCAPGTSRRTPPTG
ncbi:hypothetical protein BJF79_46605 [Actinomadura sp. CNU-125]|nr:hypothetical protein BJF79_46605 [Actinomadura sp. CNU-125]